MNDASPPHRGMRLQVVSVSFHPSFFLFKLTDDFQRPPNDWAVYELYISRRTKWSGKIKPDGRYFVCFGSEERPTSEFPAEGSGLSWQAIGEERS